tara:strand:+ start:2853 stop:3470 length:618 start_codon:yes stop_codon:yes gene_type:complete
MSRSRRFVELVRALKEASPQVVTAKSLAERFKVSERTIYRDMASLIESGVPIEGEAGSGYQLALAGGPPPLSLRWSEAEALWLGARMLTFAASHDRESAANRALERFSDLLGEERVARLERDPLLTHPELPAAGRHMIQTWEHARQRGETVKVHYGRTRETADILTGRAGLTAQFGSGLVLDLETADGLRRLRADRIVKLVVSSA